MARLDRKFVGQVRYFGVDPSNSKLIVKIHGDNYEEHENGVVLLRAGWNGKQDILVPWTQIIDITVTELDPEGDGGKVQGDISA